MKKYVCDVCGYIYDPEKGDPDSGIAPGTPFEAIPDNWKCPLCGIGKDSFSVMEKFIMFVETRSNRSLHFLKD